jgi:hypothetical protein
MQSGAADTPFPASSLGGAGSQLDAPVSVPSEDTERWVGLEARRDVTENGTKLSLLPSM